MNRLMKNVLFHQLSGNYVRGWSNFFTHELDVARVVHITAERRSFMIFDRKYPFTMRIEYKQKTVENEIGIGIAVGSHPQPVLMPKQEIRETQYISVRYNTLKEINREIYEINKKKERLQIYTDKYMSEVSQKISEIK